ncbi:MAG: TraV family lipoprotein [Burkholderiales bacterium]
MNELLHSTGAICGALALALSGCANMSGLDAGSSYGCKAPEGVKCDSVSGVYYNAIQNNLPSQQRQPLSAPPAAPPGMLQARASVPSMPASTGPALLPAVAIRQPAASAGSYMPVPLRAAPRVFRLWIKPWEDADRDLNSESLLYVQVDDGRWMVDHVQRQVRDAYAPIRPGQPPAIASSGTAAPTAVDRAAALSPLDTNAAVQQALSTLNAQQPPRPAEPQ